MVGSGGWKFHIKYRVVGLTSDNAGVWRPLHMGNEIGQAWVQKEMYRLEMEPKVQSP